MNILTHFSTLYKLCMSHMRVTYVYFCHVCNLPFALFSESSKRYDLPLRFLLRGFTCILEHTGAGVGKIADVHHEKGKRHGDAARRVGAYTHVAYVVRVITLTKRRIACYFRCDLFPPHTRSKNISQIFQSRGFTVGGRAVFPGRKKM